MVKCTQCGGDIDEITLVCKKCGKKYTREEYNSLLSDFILSSLKEENIDKNYENVSNKLDSIERWLRDETKKMEDIGNNLTKTDDEELIALREEFLEKKRELEEKGEELRKTLEDVKLLRDNIKLTFKNILNKLNFIRDLRERQDVFSLLIDYSERINELENKITEIRIEKERYENLIKDIMEIMDIKEPEKIKENIMSVMMENSDLKIELENLQNRIQMQKELWEDWVSSQSPEVRNLAERELKLKEQELLIEKQLKEMGEKEKFTKVQEKPFDMNKLRSLEEENSFLKSELERLNKLVKTVASGNTEILKKTEELSNIEKLKMENQNLRGQIEIMEKEIKDLKEKLKFKDEEYSRREQDLQFREKKVEQMMRELEAQRIEIEELKKLEKEHKIEDLEELIKRKEEQLREKEKYLREKEKEIEAKTKGLIEKEISMAQEEIISEIKEEKVRTGTRRLDDLLYGGFPMGSNIIVYGPAYTGKEVLIYSFLAEGVKKGIPAIVILIDKTIEIFEEDIKYVLPTWDTYVENGLVKYIDAYSKTIGEKCERENVVCIESQTDINAIVNAVEDIASNLKKSYKYYRLALFSLSTILTFLDAQTVVRFLQPFTTKRKKDKAVSLYLLEKGIHEENTIQLVSHLMDGTIEFKTEMGKIYLQVKGITEVQSRSWIEISPSKSGIIMGSFTLGHIR